MATYGSDASQNLITDPAKPSEKYYVKVDSETGVTTVYNQEIGVDKRVGTINPGGQVVFNENWWGNAKTHDKDFVLNNKSQLVNAAEKISRTEGGLSAYQADNLLKGNQGTVASKEAIEKGLSSIQNLPNKVGTRTKFPGSKGSEPLVFPEALRSTRQDIIKFNMLQYTPRDFDRDSFGWKDRQKNRQNIIGSTVLPIPSAIMDMNAVSWSQDDMNAIRTFAAELALEGIKKGPAGMIEATKSAAQKIAGNSEEAVAAITNTLAGMAAGNQNLITRKTGAVLNPNMELLFQAPQLRPFSFNFVLSPRSKKEAQTVIKIIRFFKQGMSPIRSKSNLFLKSPHTFQLAYKYREEGDTLSSPEVHPYLNKFKECAMQTFGVQYAPSGNYSTFGDGVMTQYLISMTFTELEPIFNDDYEASEPFPAEIGF